MQDWGSQLELIKINPRLIIKILQSYQNIFHTAKPLINQSQTYTSLFQDLKLNISLWRRNLLGYFSNKAAITVGL